MSLIPGAPFSFRHPGHLRHDRRRTVRRSRLARRLHWLQQGPGVGEAGDEQPRGVRQRHHDGLELRRVWGAEAQGLALDQRHANVIETRLCDATKELCQTVQVTSGVSVHLYNTKTATRQSTFHGVCACRSPKRTTTQRKHDTLNNLIQLPGTATCVREFLKMGASSGGA